MIDVFMDETEFSLNGRPVLLFASVIPRSLKNAIAGMLRIRQEFALEPTVEIKWSLRGVNAKTKARVKERVLALLAREFLGMVTLTGGMDKDIAFVGALKQIHDYAEESSHRFVNIYHDSGSFRSRSSVQGEIDTWTSVRCTGLASMDSKYSVGVQFADILAGIFRYIITCGLGGPLKHLQYYDGGFDHYEEITLDALFQIYLRFSMWGTLPPLDETDVNEYPRLDQVQDCFGTGVRIHGEFSEAERDTIAHLSKFYQGCLH